MRRKVSRRRYWTGVLILLAIVLGIVLAQKHMIDVFRRAQACKENHQVWDAATNRCAGTPVQNEKK